MKKTNVALCVISLTAWGCSPSATTPDFNEDWMFWSDTNQEKVLVDLPHDAMQTETRSADAGTKVPVRTIQGMSIITKRHLL